jgi:ABC-2 type transport system ATP-binding protein
LNYAADLRGLGGIAKRAAVDSAIETCFLEKVVNQSLDTLSKGYRHRTCLAQTLLHDPEVLILDEPTDGLDPNQKHVVRQLIKRLGTDKVIIFSTHILEEVEAVCTRALIIDQGRVVADGTPDTLKARANRAGSVRVAISGLSGSGIKAELSRLGSAGEIEDISETDSGLNALVYPKNKGRGNLPVEISALCNEKGLKLAELRVDEGRLDEMFREITAQVHS